MVGKGSLKHNSRVFYAENVDSSRSHLNIEYCNENIKDVYHELFDDALAITEDLYRKLGIPGLDEARPAIEKYIQSKKGYKKNKYQYDPRTVQLVNEHWGEVLDEWGYERL